jgi:hypothetical protein
MNKPLLAFVAVPALLLAGVAVAQYPMMDMVADKLVQRYQHRRVSSYGRSGPKNRGTRNPRGSSRRCKSCGATHRCARLLSPEWRLRLPTRCLNAA